MTTQTTLPRPFIQMPSLSKRMLIGAISGLAVAAFFIGSVRHANPDWGKFWMVRPFILLPVAGAAGGVFLYLMIRLGYQGGWKKAALTTLGVLGHLIALWMGVILGFAGTLWH